VPDRPADPTTSRRLTVAGVAALVVVALGAVARRTAVTDVELDVFRWFNQWPDTIARPLWLVMQLGAFWGGLVVAVLVMAVLRGWRGAVVGAVTAVAAWSVAVITKVWVSRGRPADYLTAVNPRFEHLPTGNGYPSGHAAVAFAVATLIAGSLPGRWRVLPYLLAGVVALGRLYFGAHLPLDVVGGAALGVAVGTLARFLLSEPGEAGERPARV
jgi:membrane-associated phospholipid phosphatase